jgi:hypothetical protein
MVRIDEQSGPMNRRTAPSAATPLWPHVHALGIVAHLAASMAGGFPASPPHA